MARFTADQLEALEKALAEGVQEVRYRDRTVVYRSLREMMELRDLMRRDLGMIATGSTSMYPTFKKGYE